MAGLGEKGEGIKQNKQTPQRYRQQYGDYQRKGLGEIEEGKGGVNGDRRVDLGW